MNFAIFENFDGTVNASINKKTIVTLFDSMNDNNVIEKLLTVSGKEKQRLLSHISNVLTGNKFVSVKAGIFSHNDKPAYVAYNGEKAVLVMFDGETRKVWKSFSINLRTQRAKPNDTATIMIGNPIEYKEKVNHKSDAKITNVYEELQAKIKELEEKLKKSEEQNVEKDKLIDAFVKKENGEELSMGEEFILEHKLYKASKEVAASELPFSNDSTVFIVSNTDENSNEDLIVSDDQSTETPTVLNNSIISNNNEQKENKMKTINSIKENQILITEANENIKKYGEMLIREIIEDIESGEIDFGLIEAARMFMEVTLVFSIEDAQKNDFRIQHAMQHVVCEGQKKFKHKNPWVLNESSDKKYFILQDNNNATL